MKKAFIIILAILDLGALACLFLAYGPYSGFRDWFITTSAGSWHHSYFAHVIYSDKEINDFLAQNKIYEPEGVTDASQITFNNEDPGVYESVYDEQVLKRDEGNDLYKIIEISGAKYKGYVFVVYDASRLSVYNSPKLKTGGQKITSLAKTSGAIALVNASGFKRNPETRALTPNGTLIMDGKLYTDIPGSSISGFTYDNVLTLTKESASDAIAHGMRDAVSFGPFLIVNGEPSTFTGTANGHRPRTAIGQRKDGIVLFVVIDGDSAGTRGANFNDLVDIMVRYGAYNASNLDGGGSSSLYVDGKLINDPKGFGYTGERYLINAWILK